MTSQKVKAVLLGSAIGAVLAIVFSALGAASPEPSDHPLGPAGGLIELLLLPFCLPVLIVHGYLISPILWWALPYERFGHLADGLERYVTYPAFQAIFYGAALWVCVRVIQHFRSHYEGQPPNT